MNDRKLTQFIEGISENTLIVIDEAYYEYVTAKDFPETLPLLEKHKNILVLRTFSKAYGLASFRVGYAVGQEELIEKLNVVRLPFNVSSLAQAATIAFGDDEFIEEIVRVNTEGLQQYESFCRKMIFHFIHRKQISSSCQLRMLERFMKLVHTQDLLFVRSRMVSVLQSEQGSKMKGDFSVTTTL